MDFLRKNRLLVMLGLLLLLVAYYMTSGSTSGSTSEPLSTAGGDTTPATAQLLASLASLHTINLDNSIFSDPVFLSLTDFGVVIPPENVGRRNPFSPIGSAGRTGTTTVAH